MPATTPNKLGVQRVWTYTKAHVNLQCALDENAMRGGICTGCYGAAWICSLRPARRLLVRANNPKQGLRVSGGVVVSIRDSWLGCVAFRLRHEDQLDEFGDGFGLGLLENLMSSSLDGADTNVESARNGFVGFALNHEV